MKSKLLPWLGVIVILGLTFNWLCEDGQLVFEPVSCANGGECGGGKSEALIDTQLIVRVEHKDFPDCLTGNNYVVRVKYIKDSLRTLDTLVEIGQPNNTISIVDSILNASTDSISLDTLSIDTVLYCMHNLESDLNTMVFGMEFPPKANIINIDSISNSCNCDLYLLDISYPDNINIHNGVVKSRSRTTSQDNGTIGSVGFNYLIDPGPYPATLARASDSVPRPCFRPVISGKGERFNTLDKESEDSCPFIVIDPGRKPTELKVVKVAIIDTGVDPFYRFEANEYGFLNVFNWSSEDLPDADQIMDVVNYGDPFPSPAVLTDPDGNCIFDNYFGYDYLNSINNPYDDNGHGTHIAGTVLNNSATEVSKTEIIPLKFGGYLKGQLQQDSFYCDLFSAICSINYAVNAEADIINMSWGYYDSIPNWPLEEQLARADTAGILMVTSAGNDTCNIDDSKQWPACLVDSFPEHMIVVAALDTFNVTGTSTFELASYSNFGTTVDLAAPGTDIVSAKVLSIDSTLSLSGTSMAAAVISRRAAMLRYDENGEQRTAAFIKDSILRETITDFSLCIGGGRIYDYSYDDSLPCAIGYAELDNCQ